MAEGWYKTKKELKQSIGKGLKIHETSLHGLDYRSNGVIFLRGPACSPHRWYAKVTMKDDVIVKVD